MSQSAQLTRGGSNTPPRFRILVLIVSAIVALAGVLIASNGLQAPPASAQTPTSYDICTRTTIVATKIVEHLRTQQPTIYGTAADHSSGSYTPGAFGCASGETAVVSATNLKAHTSFTAWASALDVPSASYKRGDFAGLNDNLWIHNNSAQASTLPSRLFEGVSLRHINSWGARYTSLPADLFAGAATSTRFELVLGSTLLTHEGLPYNIFDGVPQLNQLNLMETKIAHINTRWFENTKIGDANGRLLLSQTRIDTFFYEEGDGKKWTNGAKSARGWTDATLTTLVAAINAETDRKQPSNTFDLASTEVTLHATIASFGSIDLCNTSHRTRAVADAIIADLREWGAAQNPVVTTYDAASGFGCGGAQTAIITRANLMARTDMNIWSDRLDISNKSLTKLLFTDFKDVNVGNILADGNQLSELPFGIFDQITIREVHFAWNAFTKLPSDLFWGASAAADYSTIDFGGNQLNELGIPPTIFDGTGATQIQLYDNDIGRVNTRWFKELTGLTNVLLNNNPVVKHYSSNTGSYYAADATNKVAYDPEDTANVAALKAAIIAAIDTPNTVTLPGNNYRAPNGYGIDPCERTEKIWRTLMVQYRYVTSDLPDTWNNPRIYFTEVGGIRHARESVPTKQQCPVFEAEWVVKATGALYTGTPDRTIHDLAFKRGNPYHQGFDMNLSKLGATLKPSDFANFYNVRSLTIRSSGIETIPDDTFAQAPFLTGLTLSSNKLDDADFSGATNFLTPLKGLRSLNVGNNFLTEFKSSWLPETVRSNLSSLYLSSNPMRSMDLSGMNLSTLWIDGTYMTAIDPAVFEMSRLGAFWWETALMTLDGMHPSGQDAFYDNISSRIGESLPPKWLGNPNQLEGEQIDADTIAASWAHYNWQHQSNNEDSGNNLVRNISLNDPCRPDIQGVGDVESWKTDYGPLCVTSAQKDTFINNIPSFRALNWLLLMNSDLSDAQMEKLLQTLSGRSMHRLRLISNPNAFGDGFGVSKIEAIDYSRWGSLWLLRLVNTDITFPEAKALIRQIADEAFDNQPATDSQGKQYRNQGLRVLDLSYNPGLFTGVSTSDLDGLLTGIPIRPATFASGTFQLELANTDLNFDQLTTIIDSIDVKFENDGLLTLQLLDVSSNPNVWKEPASGGTFTPVPASEITTLFEKLRGLGSLQISGTNMTATQFNAMVNALDTEPPATEPHKETALDRIRSLGIGGIPMSSTTATAQFAKLQSILPTTLKPSSLSSLVLSGSDLDLDEFEAMIDGLATAGSLSTIQTLWLTGNSDLFDSCDPSSASDRLTRLISRFTDLRRLSIAASEVDFPAVQCFVNGLDRADGSSGDGAPNILYLGLSGNINAFNTTPAVGETLATKASPAAVAEIYRLLPNALLGLSGTGITSQQAAAGLAARIEQEDEDERELIEEQFNARNPVFNFRTPLPDDLRALSGRSSLRIAFTHNPMVNNEPFTISRYLYRYRVRPDNANASWGSSGTEAWRTPSIDITTTGEKTFDLFGLQAETVYQIQLRALSVALPNQTDPVSGGTTINLPQINSIKPAITEVSIRTGDQVRLEVNILGLSDILDNTLPNKDGNKIMFTWSANPSGGAFATPNDQRRVFYTAPGLPGTYTVTAAAGPDGICRSHHTSNFGITDADRAPCMATFTVRVSRAPSDIDPAPDPINPAGDIPSSLADADNTQYVVFTPVAGGTFSSEGISVTAAVGAVPDRQLIGVSAAPSAWEAPEPAPGARMTIASTLFDVLAIDANGKAVADYTLDDPLSACMPLPEAFRANISDIVIVERKTDGSYGILSTTLRQTASGLNVCGGVSTLPATVGVAKLGVVEAPPPTPMPDVETPATGATAPSAILATLTLLLAGALLLTGISSRIRRIRQNN